MSPPELHRRLRALRGHLRRLIILTGASRVALVALAALAAALLLDWAAHVETPGRVVLLALSAGLTLVALWRFLVAPLRLRLGDEQLALIVERRFPDLRDRLISTVQFAKARHPEPLSRDLIDLLTRHTVAQTGALDFHRATTPWPATRWAVAAALVVIAASLYTTHFPATAAIFASRFLNPFGGADWPRRTQLSIVAYDKDDHQLAVEGSRIYVPKGEDLHVRITAAPFAAERWRPPRRVTVYYRFPSGGSNSRTLSMAEGAAYRTSFPTVTDPFSFYATGDDAVTQTYEVAIRNRPRIQDVRITLRAPAYTGAPERVLSDGRGSFSGLAGSRALIEATTNKPIDPKPGSARILVNDQRAFPMAFVDGEPTRLRGSFRLDVGQKHYAIALVDTDGLTNSPPSTYRLDVRADRKPIVKLPEPGGSRKVTPKATVPVRLTAKDDHLVARARFVFRRGEKGKPVAHNFPEPSEPSEQVELSHPWDLTPLALKENETLHLHGEAEDNYRLTLDGKTLGPNVGRSPSYLLSVISEAAMTSLIQRKLQELKERTRKLADRQDRAKAGTQRLADSDQKLERRHFKLAEREQLRIAAGSKNIAKELEKARADMLNNKVGNPADDLRVEALANTLDTLAAKDMPDAARKIAGAAQPENKDHQKKKLGAAADKQQQISNQLRTALARFDQGHDIDQLLRDTSDLLLKQKKLNERTATLARELFGKPASRLSDKEKGALRSLAREQRGARDAMKALEKKMANTAQRLNQPNPAAAKAIQQALSQAANDQIRAHMNNAANHIQQAKPASALPPQAKSTDALKRLLDTLTRARSPSLAKDLKELHKQVGERIKDVDKLLKDERRQLTETQIGNLRRQLQSLRNQQGATQDATRNAKSPATLKEQAPNQDKHAEKADQLGRQLERLQPQDKKHREAVQNAAGDVKNAAQQMKAASENLAKADPNKARAQNQAAKADAAKAQAQAMKKLGEADKKLDDLQKQLAKGKPEKPRLTERAKAQDKTAQDAAKAAKSMQGTAKKAETTMPTTAKAVQKASQSTQKASQAMQKAQQQLSQASQAPTKSQSGQKQQDAEQQQQQAVRDLEKARQQLAQAQRQLDTQRRQKRIFELERSIAAMLVQQVGIREKTVALDKATQSGVQPFTHAQKLDLTELAEKQGKLRDQSAEVTTRLKADGIPIFHYVMHDATRSMGEVHQLLAKRQVGWLTQETEREIEQHLIELLAALKQEAQRLAQQKKQQQRGGGGKSPQKPQPLVPPLAQIKQLHALQGHINEKTRAIEVDKRVQVGRRKLLLLRRAARLATRQLELGKLAKDFADALEDQNKQEEMSPP